MARRTNDAPTRESQSRVRTPPARRPPPVDRASCCTHTHPSVVKERGSQTPIAPPGVMRAGGAIAPPRWEMGVDRYSRSRACPSRLRAGLPRVLRIPTSPCGKSLHPVILPAEPAGARFPDDWIRLLATATTRRWPARWAHPAPHPSGKNPT
jgi:hypothetical protein